MKPRMRIMVMVGALVVASVLCGLTAVLLNTMQSRAQALATEPVMMTVIPAATATPPGMNELFFTPTATYSGINTSGTAGIAVGGYVQISGTDGEGLRLRVAPGTTSEVRFLALDAEVFKVIEGPQTADSYIWWFLEAPYDQTRSGWAAANFLSVVALEPQAEATP